jgi:hypothetical protein
VGDHVFAGPELLEHLEAPGLFHDHALAVVVRVPDLDDEAIRHAPDELALGGRERDDLLAGFARAFTNELDRRLG